MEYEINFKFRYYPKYCSQVRVTRDTNLRDDDCNLLYFLPYTLDNKVIDKECTGNVDISHYDFGMLEILCYLAKLFQQ